MLKLAQKWHPKRPCRRSSRRLRRLSGTIDGSVLRHAQESPSNQVQIGQRARHEQSVGVLIEPFVAGLGEAEDPLDDQERMLDFGPDARFGLVLRPLNFVDLAFASVAAVGHILCVRCTFPNGVTLTLVSRVAPDLGLVTVQQVGQAGGIVDVGGGRRHGMDHFRAAIDADVDLHAEKPLVALLRLMHVRVSALVFVLGRRRRADDGSIHDGAFADLDAMAVEMFEDVLEDGFAECVLFEQMAETANGRLIRRGAFPEIETDEAAHGGRVVEGVLGGGVREVEPLLKEVDAEHHLQSAWWATIAGDRVGRRNQLAELGPGDDAVHVAQKLRAFGRLRVLLEAFAQGQLLAHRAVSRHVIG
jgi:hypothetical protein